MCVAAVQTNGAVGFGEEKKATWGRGGQHP